MPRICTPGELSGKYRCWITLGWGKKITLGSVFENSDLGFVEDCWQQELIVSGECGCVQQNCATCIRATHFHLWRTQR